MTEPRQLDDTLPTRIEIVDNRRMAARVLVVDDERDVCRLLTYSLEQAGFEAASASTASDALLSIGRNPPAVVVLDVGLPDLSGVEVCRRLRADPELCDVGIIMLTALGSREDRIVGLEAGADDYVVKPFDVQEVVLRVRALSRRMNERDRARAAPAGQGQLLKSGTLTVDPVTFEVRGDDQLLALRPLELKLLMTLLAEPGRVFSRAELLRQVWDIEHGSERTVDVHVRRLRINLGAHADHIETVPGFGYRAKR
jgi:DNA-binding response OmpR family regulator